MLSFVAKLISLFVPVYAGVKAMAMEIIRPSGPMELGRKVFTETVKSVLPTLDVFAIAEVWERAGLDWSTGKAIKELGPNELPPFELWLPAEFDISTDYWYRFEVAYTNAETRLRETKIMQMGSDRILTKAQAESQYGEILELYAEESAGGMENMTHTLVGVNYRVEAS